MRHTKTLRAKLLKVAARVFTIAALLGAQGLSAQSIWEGGDVENGQGLFNANCASCHLVTDGVPGLALAAEPGEQDLMERSPRHPKESILAPGLGAHIVWVGLLMGGSIGMPLGLLGGPLPARRLRS